MEFSKRKKISAGEKFNEDYEVIAETEAGFETRVKLKYKNGIEKLEHRCNRDIACDSDYNA